MRRNIIAGSAVVAVLAVGGAGIAAASGGSGEESPGSETVTVPSPSGSRMDDGKELLPQAGISEQRAIAAAQTAASGPLSEVDLEYYDGKLVFNVDVGASDVKVDASNGDVLATPSDD